ncbi:MAG: type II secretion system protein [Verrucomicrobiota bacterium]
MSLLLKLDLCDADFPPAQVNGRVSPTRLRSIFPLCRKSGFTVNELLVVMAIMGIFAAISLPVLTRSKQKNSQAGCLSNLRQTGLALNMWVDDNNGWVPPGAGAADGLLTGQTCNYRETPADHARLVYYLATYLGSPPADATDRLVKAFICPGFQSRGDRLTNITGRVYYGICGQGTGNLPGSAGLPFAPFGHPGWAGVQQPPHKRSEVQSFRSLTEVWALCDIDRTAFAAPAGGWTDPLPDQPVHGTVRNYLFFDGHVTTKSITRTSGF